MLFTHDKTNTYLNILFLNQNLKPFFMLWKLSSEFSSKFKIFNQNDFFIFFSLFLSQSNVLFLNQLITSKEIVLMKKPKLIWSFLGWRMLWPRRRKDISFFHSNTESMFMCYFNICQHKRSFLWNLIKAFAFNKFVCTVCRFNVHLVLKKNCQLNDLGKNGNGVKSEFTFKDKF